MEGKDEGVSVLDCERVFGGLWGVLVLGPLNVGEGVLRACERENG